MYFHGYIPLVGAVVHRHNCGSIPLVCRVAYRILEFFLLVNRDYCSVAFGFYPIGRNYGDTL